MKIYPEGIKQAVEQSKAIAEQSKQAAKPPAPNPDYIDKQWESVRAARQK